MGLFKKQAPQQEETPEETTEQHKSLVNIFQDRNLLKRKLDEAEAERTVLRADVEDLRKRHDELQRQLSSLEKMLIDPERGQSAILYYRLRAVWDTCRQQIKALAEELSTRQEQLERERLVSLREGRVAHQVGEHDRRESARPFGHGGRSKSGYLKGGWVAARTHGLRCIRWAG